LTLVEFDALGETERSLWIEEWRREQAECPDCGRPREQCSDSQQTWYPYRQICYATMARTAAKEQYDALHERAIYHDGSFTSWKSEQTRSHPYRFDAGVNVGVATEDPTPWDKFTTEREASPVRPDDDDAEEA